MVCALVSALYGCDARRFECLGSERSNDPSAPLRAGLWKCEGVAGPVFFRVLSEGDASDVDIRDATFVIDTGDAYGQLPQDYLPRGLVLGRQQVLKSWLARALTSLTAA